MKLYLDVIFGINLAFDFLLLLTVSMVLKRKTSLKRIGISALIGGFSILFLFLPLSSISLFLLKVIISIFMILTAFGWKSRKYFLENICYLYLVSIILGGFLYYLNIEFSYKNVGLVFFFEGASIPVLFLIIVSPIILYLYYKGTKKASIIQENYHTVEIILEANKLTLNAYLDTGNHLYDPYHHRPILLIFSKDLEIPYEEAIIVPYEVVGHKGILKCRKVKQIIVDGTKEIKNVLIAKSEEPFQIDGVEALLHPDFFK